MELVGERDGLELVWPRRGERGGVKDKVWVGTTILFPDVFGGYGISR
jgi:hypothetical protein